MKNLFRLFVLMAVLFSAFTETVDAQTRRGRATQTISGGTNTTSGNSFNDKLSGGTALTPAGVLDYYIDFDNESSLNCIGAIIVTNEVSKHEYPVYSQYPIATWIQGGFGSKPDKSGLKSSNQRRHWSNRLTDDYQPFDMTKTEKVGIELNKVGNSVEGWLIKEGGGNLPIKIFAVMTKGHGHILYGSYGNHGGFITISLFKTGCDVG